MLLIIAQQSNVNCEARRIVECGINAVGGNQIIGLQSLGLRLTIIIRPTAAE